MVEEAGGGSLHAERLHLQLHGQLGGHPDVPHAQGVGGVGRRVVGGAEGALAASQGPTAGCGQRGCMGGSGQRPCGDAHLPEVLPLQTPGRLGMGTGLCHPDSPGSGVPAVGSLLCSWGARELWGAGAVVLLAGGAREGELPGSGDVSSVLAGWQGGVKPGGTQSAGLLPGTCVQHPAGAQGQGTPLPSLPLLSLPGSRQPRCQPQLQLGCRGTGKMLPQPKAPLPWHHPPRVGAVEGGPTRLGSLLLGTHGRG